MCDSFVSCYVEARCGPEFLNSYDESSWWGLTGGWFFKKGARVMINQEVIAKPNIATNWNYRPAYQGNLL
jgi:hypothetical protein